jgi:hypothetical protein
VKRAAFPVLFSFFALASTPAFADSPFATLARTLLPLDSAQKDAPDLPVRKNSASAETLPASVLRPGILSIQPVPLSDALSFNRAIEESA